MLNREDFIRIVKEEMTRFFAKEIVKEEIFHYLTMTEDGEVELHNNKVEPPKPPAEDGTDAAAQAKALGLHHIGWGRWADQTGKEVAKTVQGHLVKVEPKDQELPTAKDMHAQAGREKPDTGDQHGIGHANATMPAASVPQTHPVTHMVSKQNHDEPYANQAPSAQPVEKPASGYQGSDVERFPGGEKIIPRYTNVPHKSHPVTLKPNATPTDDPYSDTPHVLRGAKPEKYKTSEFGNGNQQTISRAVKAMKNGTPEQQAAIKAQLDKMRVPGSITPPKQKDGSPWEVIDANGKTGMIDFINKNDGEAHISYDDGTMDMVPLRQLKPRYPSNKQPEPEPQELYPGDPGESDTSWMKD